MRLIGLIFLMLIAASCFDEGDCLITNSNIIRVSLKQFKDKKTPVQIAFTSVEIPGDTILYQNVTTTVLDLPVNPGEVSVEYLLKYNGKSETLKFQYDNVTIVPSPTCGALPYQRNLVLSSTTIGTDSVVVVNQSLLRNVAENVSLYF